MTATGPVYLIIFDVLDKKGEIIDSIWVSFKNGKKVMTELQKFSYQFDYDENYVKKYYEDWKKDVKGYVNFNRFFFTMDVILVVAALVGIVIIALNRR